MSNTVDENNVATGVAASPRNCYCTVLPSSEDFEVL